MYLPRFLIPCLALFCIFGFSGVTPLGAFAFSAEHDGSLETRVEQAIRSQVTRSSITCQGELICGTDVLPAFYAQHDHQPVWGLTQGVWSKAEAMVDCIHASATQAMRPADYHVQALEELLADLQSQWPTLEPQGVADADILLTDAFLTLAGHLRAGRVNPQTLYPSWVASAHAPDLIAALNRALDSRTLGQELKRQLPPHLGYHTLRRAWERYARLAEYGGWPHIIEGKNLELGEYSPRVIVLMQRLAITGDFTFTPHTLLDTRFRHNLDDAVRSFQHRHGLRVDGIVGPKTLAALNVSAQERSTQLALNLERWRWIPRDLGSPHVRVNVADFTLTFQDSQGFETRQRVIVGKTARRTPVFSDRITYLVLNPTWNVPRSIMIKDILPKVIKDPEYLDDNAMTLLSGWGEKAQEIDPQSIDWQNVDPKSFPYRLRQEPGPENALGRIKFMFPNPFSIYLHDTPHKALFERVSRDFSSGCIRVEHPLALALAVLGPERNWDESVLRKAIASGRTRVIRLSHPVPVHLLYWTAWVDHAGKVHFREDIYERDNKLQAALAQRTPSSESVAYPPEPDY
ncbi:MAG: L,D-transpeptidase family protein [Desulfovermiculus sp.]|nr:L,D-transpeptidase family protein [Desulfovermiculus sp.]